MQTRWDWLRLAGLITLAGGLASVGIGTVCSVVYVYLARRTEPQQQIFQRAWFVWMLYLANFVAAFAILVVVASMAQFHSSSYYHVQLTVINYGPAIDDSRRLRGVPGNRRRAHCDRR